MNNTVILILLVIAFILAIVEVVRSEGRSAIGWSGVVGWGTLILARLVS